MRVLLLLLLLQGSCCCSARLLRRGRGQLAVQLGLPACDMEALGGSAVRTGPCSRGA